MLSIIAFVLLSFIIAETFIADYLKCSETLCLKIENNTENDIDQEDDFETEKEEKEEKEEKTDTEFSFDKIALENEFKNYNKYLLNIYFFSVIKHIDDIQVPPPELV